MHYKIRDGCDYNLFWKVIEGMLETVYYWEDHLGKETKIGDLDIDFLKVYMLAFLLEIFGNLENAMPLKWFEDF